MLAKRLGLQRKNDTAAAAAAAATATAVRQPRIEIEMGETHV
jgi:hypothetical protein